MKLSALFTTRYLPHAKRTLKARTVAEYKRLADKLILPKFGERDIAAITLDDLEAWHEEIPGAVQANRALATLSAALTYAVERRLLTENPCHRFAHWNKERAREFFYSPEQTKAILSTALSWPDIRGCYIAFELLTGCRPNEVRDIAPNWRTKGAVRTPDHKGRRNHIVTGRTIFLSPPAEAILDRLDPIYPRPGNPGASCYFPAYMDLRRAWSAIVAKAGVPKARLYDLRHTFASAALAAGTGLDVVGLMLGHRKRETTLRYAHLAPDIGVNAAAAAATRMGADDD